MAPAAARRSVASMLREWGFDDEGWVQHAMIVVSELVTNAVVHGGGCLALEVQADEGHVTVAAVDGSAVLPQSRVADDGGGRGIRLIEALAAAWGVQDHQDGKRVWAMLPPHPPHQS
jgi:anti-sigma regulatory factor (Ser/Thr protein kinase)